MLGTSHSNRANNISFIIRSEVSAKRVAYSFRDVLKATSASRSQLIHWTNTNLILPDIADTAGTGHARRFSFQNLVEVRIAVVLAGFGLRVDGLRFVLGHLRSQLRRRRPMRDDVLVLNGNLRHPKQLWMGTLQEFLVECRRPMFLAQAGLFVNVGAIVGALEASTNDRW